MTGSASVAEPPCPDALPTPRPDQDNRDDRDAPAVPGLRVEQRPLSSISQERWDALATANPWATPFSTFAFQRAWWDAYGPNAEDVTLAVLRDDGRGGDDGLVAILPLMRRVALGAGEAGEAVDVEAQPQLRHGHRADLTPVPSGAKTLYMGASYHADYATVLVAPPNLEPAARAIAGHLAGDEPGSLEWDVLDLRRLRCGDPAPEALAAALGAREIEKGWTLNLEREDVCPVAEIPADVDFDGYLATLRSKDRHEIRRKLRRAEAAGAIAFEVSPDPLADLETFIDLHQARWGAEGLFADTRSGRQSRTFLRRLFELSGPNGDVQLAFLSVGGRRIAAGIHFLTPDSILYYNAGLDPDALELSPGVLLIAAYVRLAIETGRRRLDFLRGDEPYKYQWGAVDEPIRRLLVRRTGTGR